MGLVRVRESGIVFEIDSVKEKEDEEILWKIVEKDAEEREIVEEKKSACKNVEAFSLSRWQMSLLF